MGSNEHPDMSGSGAARLVRTLDAWTNILDAREMDQWLLGQISLPLSMVLRLEEALGLKVVSDESQHLNLVRLHRYLDSPAH